MPDLAGSVALVTGGSGGIGAAIARRLAAEGANVALTYQYSRDHAEAVVTEIEPLQLEQVGVERLYQGARA